MAKPTLSSYLRENLDQVGRKKKPGPFVTISRQYGCGGPQLGRALVDKLNDRLEEDAETHWRMYHKELLQQLAEDTGVSREFLEKERIARPGFFKDILRGIRRSNMPDGYEIRNKITQMVRGVAFEGGAVIIGQGGSSATADLDNGLSVRIEASKDWRIARIAAREQLDRQAALARIQEIEKQRAYLRRIYEQMQPRQPSFHLVIDHSVFTADQVVDLIVSAMELRGLIAGPDGGSQERPSV